MKHRTAEIVLSALVITSVALNVIQHRNYARAEERLTRSSVIENLHRLSINRKILVDTEHRVSPEARKLLHSSVFMDLARIRPNVADLSESYQVMYQEILADLNKYRQSNGRDFSAENLAMDAEMYSQYIDWISTEYTPE